MGFFDTEDIPNAAADSQDNLTPNNTAIGNDQLSNDNMDFNNPANFMTDNNPVNADAVTDPNQNLSGEEKRFQYWQQKHDKLNNEFSQLKTQYEGVDPSFVAVAKHLQSNPALLQQVFAGKPADAVQDNQLKVPARPSRPQNFNEIEAVSDPSSESYKFRQANDLFRDQMYDYQMEGLRREREDFAKLRTESAQVTEQDHAMNNLRNELTLGYGLQGNDVNDFIKDMSDPNSMSIPNLVEYYNFKKGRVNSAQNNAQSVRDKAAQLAARNNNHTYGAGITTANGSGNNQPNGDQFQNNFYKDLAGNTGKLFETY
ncbi:MAG: hypothetical protein KKA84_12075 [Bacteroidetes bacterium]|nr:hypothetical protein [Bacteroidota bacterium]